MLKRVVTGAAAIVCLLGVAAHAQEEMEMDDRVHPAPRHRRGSRGDQAGKRADER